MLRLSESHDTSRNVRNESAEGMLPPGSTSPYEQNTARAHAAGAHTRAHDLVESDLSLSTDDMRARMTIALDDQLHDHPEMAALFEQKLAIEGASPKPCIVPGNALQLIDDDPAASRSHTPSSIIVLDSEPHGPREPSADSGSNDARRPIPRVRFRSRVRITSGLRRSRHASDSAVPPTTAHASPCSSASDSPSSSISAPIRWQADENAAWGPLGRRLSAYASQNGWQKRVPSAPRSQLRHGGSREQPQARSKIDERTPLIRSGRHVAYVDSGLDGGGEADDERLVEGEYESDDEEAERDRALRAAALKREEEAVFGPWPWRLLNRHWWWWHAEPVLCVCCADESDFDE